MSTMDELVKALKECNDEAILETIKKMNMPTIRLFYLNRVEDESGVSGTGQVAIGIIFPDGKVAMEWQTEFKSLTVFDSIEIVEKIHGHAGKTRIEYIL